MSRRLRYGTIAVALIVAATLPFMARLQDTHHWVAFFILGTAAATAQLFRVQTPRDQAFWISTSRELLLRTSGS